MKTIVTHIRPDMDATASAWLIYTYLPGWSNAEFKFVGAGLTLDNLPPDDNADIIHVDTGMGKFDHHQFKAKLSATKMVFNFLVKENYLPEKDAAAVERLMEYVNTIDNFGEIYFTNPTDDLYQFLLHELIEGHKAKITDDVDLMKFAFANIEAVVQILKNKARAEKEIKEAGFNFESKFGKSLALETKNEEAMKIALKQGYKLVIRKDPDKGHARFKTPPEKAYDLTPVYEMVKKKDPKGTWFLHASLNMLLNGSSKNPHSVATELTLTQLIEIVKKI
jgi:hypothetical protein